MTPPSTPSSSIPRVWWVGVAAVVVYVLVVAVGGNLVGDAAGDDEFLEFALSHFIPVPIAIALGVLFLRRARWGSRVWSEAPTFRMAPRRPWLLAIPVLMLVLVVTQAFDVPWADRSVGLMVTVLLATALVGIGEELFFRGILLESIRGRHGELVTLLGTSLLFGIAHVLGSIWAGVPAAAIAFQVTFLAANGSLLYWVRRTTGRLWVAVAIHALTDCILYLAVEPTRASETPTQDVDPTSEPILAVVQTALIAAALAGVVSAAREDHRTRRSTTSRGPATAAGQSRKTADANPEQPPRPRNH